MRIHFASGQNMFRLQMQNPLQNTMGQVQNAGLQKIIQQININYGNKKNRDTVELSQKALELLDASKTKKADEAKKPEAAFAPQKYAPEMFATLDKGKQYKQQQNGLSTLPKTPPGCKKGGVFA